MSRLVPQSPKVHSLKNNHDECLGRAIKGDTTAFASLYREFAPFAYSILKRQLGSCPQVDDLLQQVFIKVYRELPVYKGDKPFRAWLRRACYFTVYDYLRQSKRHKAVSIEEESSIAHIQANCDSPEFAYIQSEIKRHSLRNLDKLTAEKRMALVMHDFEGHSLDEIAEMFGVSKFTIRTRLVRARREFAGIATKNKRLMQLIGSKKTKKVSK